MDNYIVRVFKYYIRDVSCILPLLEEKITYVSNFYRIRLPALSVYFLFLFFLSDDWQGLDGMVIQKNPDENVNHLPSAAICEVDGITNVNDQSCVNKRYHLFLHLFAFVCLYVFQFVTPFESLTVLVKDYC